MKRFKAIFNNGKEMFGDFEDNFEAMRHFNKHGEVDYVQLVVNDLPIRDYSKTVAVRFDEDEASYLTKETLDRARGLLQKRVEKTFIDEIVRPQYEPRADQKLFFAGTPVKVREGIMPGDIVYLDNEEEETDVYAQVGRFFNRKS